jgi:uroporphyrin-3 C-methyltransferase
MTDKKQQTNKPDETVVEAEIIEAETKQSSSMSPVLWGAVVILLLGCVYLYWLNVQQQRSIAEIQAQLNAQQDPSALVESLESKVVRQAESYHQLLEQLAEQQKTTAGQLASLAEKQQLTSAEIQQQWAIAEIKSLLTTANQRLHLAGDVEAAIKALELADGRLEILGDYRMHPLRAILAEEQMALAALAKVDVEGMVLKIQTAIDQVPQLQIVSGPAVSQVSEEDDLVAPDTWQQAVSGVWKEVRSLVVIRHKQDGSNAVLVPEERYFLYQNLRLQLEAARYALLQNEQTLYQQSLNAAVNWLNEYFVGDSRDAMVTLLNALAEQQLITERPDISGSSTWLQQQDFTQ